MDLIHLRWDSEFFGFPIARVEGNPEAQELEELAIAAETRCAYYTCSCGKLDAIRAAEQAGFQLIDVRVVLDAPLSVLSASAPRSTPPDCVIEVACEQDLGDLKEIAAGLSTYSRFTSDPRFGARQSGRLFDRWIELSLEGRAAVFLVARRDGRTLGFMTCRVDGGVAAFELVGVREEATGAGVGSALTSQAALSLQALGQDAVQVATQGRNRRALRFYESLGFRTRDISLVYHRWFDPKLPA